MGVQSTGLNADPGGEALMQAITFPEEDRSLFTAAGWHGEYRWFRSPNVVPLERWRTKQKPNQPAQK
jgi:hypothetical protein